MPSSSPFSSAAHHPPPKMTLGSLLTPLGLSQNYSPTIIKNLAPASASSSTTQTEAQRKKYNDNVSVLLAKLSKLRCQDLTMMGIEDFGDQRKLIARFQEVCVEAGLIKNKITNKVLPPLNMHSNSNDTNADNNNNNPSEASLPGSSDSSHNEDVVPSNNTNSGAGRSLDDKLGGSKPPRHHQAKHKETNVVPVIDDDESDIYARRSTRPSYENGDAVGGQRNSRRNSRSSFDFTKAFKSIDKMHGELDKDAKKEKVGAIRRKSFDNNGTPKRRSFDNNHSSNSDETSVGGGKERKKFSSKNGVTASEQAGDNPETEPVVPIVSEKAFHFHSSDVTLLQASLKKKQIAYGTAAQGRAQAQHNLNVAGRKVLKHFVSELSSERGSIMFFDAKNSEIFFYDEHGNRIHFSVNEGIAGHVARTGEILRIKDAYSDDRFNRQIDKQTGFRTRSLLCAPIRSKSGSEILAVVQMLNKKSSKSEHIKTVAGKGEDSDYESEGFTTADSDVIQACCMRVAEVLDKYFGLLVEKEHDMELYK